MNNMAPVNRLKDEKSLYLLQHKDNPVAWWPFNDEAIAEAKRLNRPIFLSIGYSSCHWCHVMAHESFEDEQTAKFLNDSFINIKVDREELPDVDQYYQEVCQLFNRPGGWPLSVFLLPTTDPFFVGTYFPKFPAHGLPSFKQLATDILRAYNERRSEIDQDTLKIKQAILKGPQLKDPPEIQENLPHANSILDALDRYLDKDFGGYGSQATAFGIWRT